MYPFISNTFYENIVQLLEKFASVNVIHQIFKKENEDEAHTFLTHMLRVATLGMLTSKYLYLNNCGFERNATRFYKKLGLSSDHVKQCCSTLFSICCDANYINLPRNYQANKMDYGPLTSDPDPATSSSSNSKKSSTTQSQTSSSRQVKGESSSTANTSATDILSVLRSTEGQQIVSELMKTSQMPQSHIPYYYGADQYSSDQISYYGGTYQQATTQPLLQTAPQQYSPSTPVQDEQAASYSGYNNGYNNGY